MVVMVRDGKNCTNIAISKEPIYRSALSISIYCLSLISMYIDKKNLSKISLVAIYLFIG